MEKKRTKIERLAITFWQHDLAKFFPKSLGPTTCEMRMFNAGYQAGRKSKAKLLTDVKTLRRLLSQAVQLLDDSTYDFYGRQEFLSSARKKLGGKNEPIREEDQSNRHE